MPPLAQLLDPDQYRPCDWDLRADAAGREYWLGLFRWHLDAVMLPMLREEYPDCPADRLAAYRTDYLTRFDDIARRPEQYQRLDVLHFTLVRHAAQTAHGFHDPFLSLKRRETQTAVALLPGLLADLDAAEPAARRELLLRGLLAGNIFDLGSRAAVDRYRRGLAEFGLTRESLPARPWRWDDTDTWWSRLDTGRQYRHAVMFVDNAGADIVLGCLPWVRELLRAGTKVTLAANREPALNDITAPELAELVPQCARLDTVLAAALADERLTVASTGSAAPLLDLRDLEPAFVAQTRDADLIHLHGMGRAVESNSEARFYCDCLRSAVLKDEAVAKRLGAQVFDCVFRYTAAT